MATKSQQQQKAQAASRVRKKAKNHRLPIERKAEA